MEKQNDIKNKLDELGFLFLVIQKHIMEIPEMKSMDLFFNQFETQKDGGSDGKMNPRILVEILPETDRNGFGKHREYIAHIRLHIGIDLFGTTYSKSKHQNKNLAYLSLLDDIYKKMITVSSWNMEDSFLLESPAYKAHQFELEERILAVNSDAIKVSTMDFSCIFEDDSLVKTQKTVILADTTVDVNTI